MDKDNQNRKREKEKEREKNVCVSELQPNNPQNGRRFEFCVFAYGWHFIETLTLDNNKRTYMRNASSEYTHSVKCVKYKCWMVEKFHRIDFRSSKNEKCNENENKKQKRSNASEIWENL